MLQAIDIDLGNDISRFPRQLDEIVETLTDVEMVCFQVVKFSEEKTLSFFRAMADVDSARSFRSFLSSRSAEEQNLVILF
jgi:GTP cyclohydrolase FolE2